MATEPTIRGFLKHCDFRLWNHQVFLAALLISYRRAHFKAGYRGGRTTVVRQVQKYFDWCGHSTAGREI